MRLDPEARALLNELMQEAHSENMTRNGAPPSSVAATFVQKLREQEGSGVEWVGDVLHQLTTSGAQKAAADWRRTHLIAAKTTRGKAVDVPEYAGAILRDAAGKARHVQMPLDYMDVASLFDHMQRLERQRDTLSARVQVFRNLIETLQADPGMTTAEALERISA